VDIIGILGGLLGKFYFKYPIQVLDFYVE